MFALSSPVLMISPQVLMISPPSTDDFIKVVNIPQNTKYSPQYCTDVIQCDDTYKIMWHLPFPIVFQPFCDGAHRKKSKGISPLRFKAEDTGVAFLCGCKQTKNPPYCDGTHMCDEVQNASLGWNYSYHKKFYIFVISGLHYLPN